MGTKLQPNATILWSCRDRRQRTQGRLPSQRGTPRIGVFRDEGVNTHPNEDRGPAESSLVYIRSNRPDVVNQDRVALVPHGSEADGEVVSSQWRRVRRFIRRLSKWAFQSRERLLFAWYDDRRSKHSRRFSCRAWRLKASKR